MSIESSTPLHKPLHINDLANRFAEASNAEAQAVCFRVFSERNVRTYDMQVKENEHQYEAYPTLAAQHKAALADATAKFAKDTLECQCLADRRTLAAEALANALTSAVCNDGGTLPADTARLEQLEVSLHTVLDRLDHTEKVVKSSLRENECLRKEIEDIRKENKRYQEQDTIKYRELDSLKSEIQEFHALSTTTYDRFEKLEKHTNELEKRIEETSHENLRLREANERLEHLLTDQTSRIGEIEDLMAEEVATIKVDVRPQLEKVMMDIAILQNGSGGPPPFDSAKFEDSNSRMDSMSETLLGICKQTATLQEAVYTNGKALGDVQDMVFGIGQQPPLYEVLLTQFKDGLKALEEKINRNNEDTSAQISDLKTKSTIPDSVDVDRTLDRCFADLYDEIKMLRVELSIVIEQAMQETTLAFDNKVDRVNSQLLVLQQSSDTTALLVQQNSMPGPSPLKLATNCPPTPPVGQMPILPSPLTQISTQAAVLESTSTAMAFRDTHSPEDVHRYQQFQTTPTPVVRQMHNTNEDNLPHRPQLDPLQPLEQRFEHFLCHYKNSIPGISRRVNDLEQLAGRVEFRINKTDYFLTTLYNMQAAVNADQKNMAKSIGTNFANVRTVTVKMSTDMKTVRDAILQEMNERFLLAEQLKALSLKNTSFEQWFAQIKMHLQSLDIASEGIRADLVNMQRELNDQIQESTNNLRQSSTEADIAVTTSLLAFKEEFAIHEQLYLGHCEKFESKLQSQHQSLQAVVSNSLKFEEEVEDLREQQSSLDADIQNLNKTTGAQKQVIDSFLETSNKAEVEMRRQVVEATELAQSNADSIDAITSKTAKFVEDQARLMANLDARQNKGQGIVEEQTLGLHKIQTFLNSAATIVNLGSPILATDTLPPTPTTSITPATREPMTSTPTGGRDASERLTKKFKPMSGSNRGSAIPSDRTSGKKRGTQTLSDLSNNSD